jgi:hypothetical protein
MNRRELFGYAAGGLAALTVPSLGVAQSPPKPPPWFTKNQLLHLFKQLDGTGTRETIDMVKPKFWNGHDLEPHEALFLGIMRMSNVMHRKTLDAQSKQWIVVGPRMCRHELWYKYVFSDYSTPGKEGGEWVKKPWRTRIKEEVTPGVYHIGHLNSKWNFYVCEGFPDNKLMLGMGHREVIHFRRGGMVRHSWGDYPEMIPYMGKPTRKNYAVITLAY